MSRSIFRFFPFETFVDVVLTKKLTLVSYRDWEDPYEGFLIRLLDTPDGSQRIYQMLIKRGFSPDDARVRVDTLKIFSSGIFMQSWTSLDESDALWRIYGNGNRAIRVEVDRRDILSISGFELADVTYVPTVSIDKAIEKVFHRDKIRFSEAFNVKRSAFSHEKEVRIISHLNLNNIPGQVNNFPMPQNVAAVLVRQSVEAGQISERDASKLIEQMVSGSGNAESVRSSNKKILHLDFSKKENFIKSIMCHPLSPQWVCDIVQRFCEENKLNYIGKSKLYEIRL